jgi:hypothetical protein
MWDSRPRLSSRAKPGSPEAATDQCFERTTLGQLPTGHTESFLDKIIPESALGSAALSILLTVPLGLGFALLASQILANYGWGLFVALPFTMGLQPLSFMARGSPAAWAAASASLASPLHF